ncbi:serine protease inhibitor 28Dc-like isoform X2 [Armigeres subalbatus]|uniref:serine protease inhibitor 28Dc-like isoform X2 n=1 Tax=Armigeres subalbatus TaxID=124917 RepID=UPI002ED4E634
MRILAPVGLVVLVIISYCQGQNQDSTVGSTPENLAAVSQSVTNLAQKISLAIANPKSKTEIFSPVSIAGALSLLLLGSGGATRDELINVMGFQNSRLSFTDIHKSFGRLFQDLVSNEPAQNVNIPWRANDKCNNYDYDEEDYVQQKPSSPQRGRRDTDATTPFDLYSHEIQMANGLFVDNSFLLNPNYERFAKGVYQAEVETLEFSQRADDATHQINSWVDRNTHGKIPEMFSAPLGSNTVMVIASALYFKALWEQMFIEGGTRPRDFYPEGRNQSAIKVDMMAHGGCFPYYESSELDARILGIPYKNNLTTMYIIKPNNSNRSVLLDLIAKLKADVLDEMISKMKQVTAVILFPKMHISSTLNLKKTLKNLNVRSIFSAPKSNLSLISGDDNRMMRPAVNLPIYNNKIPAKPNDFTDRLVVSRYQNESSSENTQTGNPTTADLPTTIETTVATIVEDEEDTPTGIPVSSEQPPTKRQKRDVSYKVPSEVKNKPEPLTSKDFFAKKRIVKTTPGKKSHRMRRNVQNLFVSDAIHKVDLEINERGTEGGAATAISLNRSGTSAVLRADEPFLIVIRNDKTKLPIFYGAVYDPSP